MSLFKKKKNGKKVVNPYYSLGFANFSCAFFFHVFPIIYLRAWNRLRKPQLAGSLFWLYSKTPTFFKLALKFSLLFILAGHSLTYMKSVFRNCQQDRLWKFDCGFNEASKEFCHWSHGYANDAKDGIFFYCPNNGFISGKAFNEWRRQIKTNWEGGTFEELREGAP